MSVAVSSELEAIPESTFGLPSIVGWGLVGAAALSLVGTILRLQSDVYPARPEEGLAQRRVFSFTSWNGLHWGRATFVITLAVIATVGVLLAVRPTLRRAGFACGFTISAVGATAHSFVLLKAPPTVHYGPGFYVGLIALWIEAVVAVVIAVRVLATARCRVAPPRQVVGLAALAGLSAAVTTLIRDVVIRGLPIWTYSPLTIRSGLAALVAFAVAGVSPILAVFTRASVAFVLGLLSVIALGLMADLLHRYLDPIIPYQLSIGFWITVITAVLLATLAIRLRVSPRREPIATHASLPIGGAPTTRPDRGSEPSWEDSVTYLLSLDSVRAARAAGRLLELARPRWEDRVVARTSMHSLWLTLPGATSPFADELRVSWSDRMYTFTLVRDGEVVDTGKAQEFTAGPTFDAYLTRLVSRS